MANFDSMSTVLSSNGFSSRLAKKLEHSWKALVHDGVRRLVLSILLKCDILPDIYNLPHLALLTRIPCRCTDPVSTRNDLKSSCATSSSGRPRVSVQGES